MISRVFLIGFMGSGKTTVGRQLAQQLGYDFIDLDEWIEAEEGKTISQIFAERGEAGFRLLEKVALRTIGTRGHIVISTGGGAPCFHQNMEWMNSQGVTVFLNSSEDTLFYRLKTQQDQRPLIAGMETDELKSFIKTRRMERMPYYVEAKIEMVDLPSPQQTVTHLLKVLSDQ